MGVFFRHDVVMVVSGDESDYVDSLGSHLEGLEQDVPVYDKELVGHQVRFTSMGYGIFDFKSIPLPDTLVGIVHKISGCQGQNISMVDSLTPYDLDEWVDYDYSDPYSDYWTEDNPEFNFYTTEPSYSTLMGDYEGDDEDDVYDQRYQSWLDGCVEKQTNEFNELVEALEGQV